MSNFNFNDTFDNFILPSSLKLTNDGLDKTNKNTIENNSIGIISFDDSAFLRASFNISNPKETDVQEKCRYSNVNTDNVSNFIVHGDGCDNDALKILPDDFDTSSFNISEHLLQNIEKRPAKDDSKCIHFYSSKSAQKDVKHMTLYIDNMDESDDVLDTSDKTIQDNSCNILSFLTKQRRNSKKTRKKKSKKTNNCSDKDFNLPKKTERNELLSSSIRNSVSILEAFNNSEIVDKNKHCEFMKQNISNEKTVNNNSDSMDHGICEEFNFSMPVKEKKENNLSKSNCIKQNSINITSTLVKGNNESFRNIDKAAETLMNLQESKNKELVNNFPGNDTSILENLNTMKCIKKNLIEYKFEAEPFLNETKNRDETKNDLNFKSRTTKEQTSSKGTDQNLQENDITVYPAKDYKANIFRSSALGIQNTEMGTKDDCKNTASSSNNSSVIFTDDSFTNMDFKDKLDEIAKEINSFNLNSLDNPNMSRNSNVDNNEKSEFSPLSCDLADWNLPEMILHKYAKNNVTKMFEWQMQCLSNKEVLLNNKNLVYSAPTSAGKTLVAEILGLKTLIERRKKVIFVLPFVSVVREKMFHFQDLLSTSGIRVDGFMGSYHPPGGFKTVQLAICTIEKANSLINRLLEENELTEIGAIIIDEMHLLGDSSRGYLLELLLTKLKYMTRKIEELKIQIIGMSATLPNLELLAKWLNAELFTTTFRPIPLFEQCHVQGEIYDNNLALVRKLSILKELEIDTDNILQLCLETIQSSCSVLIFCPTKNWCESLSQQISMAFLKIGTIETDLGQCLRKELNTRLIIELLEQLKRCPVGLDKILSKTVSFGVAFHHAGLTMDERDIIEGGFKTGAIRVLVATSTLSSGVNLPARRVIIRTPNFHGKPLDTLTYRQMIGRAGRMGKDVAGESLLICQKNDHKIAKELMSANLEPVESCLHTGKLKRAILEIIASGVASTLDEVNLFSNCTLLSHQKTNELENPIKEAMDFLIRNEFIRMQTHEDGTTKCIATSLAKACLSSSLPPEEGLSLFTELEKARQCFVLETELHLIYLVTPYSCSNQWGNVDWMFFLSLWEKLPTSMKRVGELVGIREGFMVNASRGKIQSNQKLFVHKRFYTALALQDLVNEVPLHTVASKFNCSRGLLQSLQQSASTFAGMVTAFSKQLGWTSVEMLISQFQDRLHFGINRDLLDLMKLPIMNGPRARTLFNAGIQTLAILAASKVESVENILHKVAPFESEKKREGESEFDAEKRNKIRSVWVTGKQGLTEREAAEMLIRDARKYIQLEMGFVDAQWETSKLEIVEQIDKKDKIKTKNLFYRKEEKAQIEMRIGPKILEEPVNTCTDNDISDYSLFGSPLQSNSSSEWSSLDLKLSLNTTDINIDSKSNIKNEVFESSRSLHPKIDTTLKLIKSKTTDRKRKLVKSDSNSSDSSNTFVETSSKKRKCSLKKKRKSKPEPCPIIPSKVSTCNRRNSESPQSGIIDLAKINVENVCDNEKIFKIFQSQLGKQKEISLSVGCAEVERKRSKIGLRSIQNDLKVQSLYSRGNKVAKGISICWGGNTIYFVSFEPTPVSEETKINLVRRILNDPNVKVRIFYGKEQIKVIKLCFNIDFNAAIEDPIVGDWLLDPDRDEKNLHAMIVEYLPDAVNLVESVGMRRRFGSIGLDVHNSATPRVRSSIEAVVTWHLVDSVLNSIRQEPNLLHAYNLEMLVIRILARMELTGLGVNHVKLEELSNILVHQNSKLESRAFKIAGRKFSFLSSKDVANILGTYDPKKKISTNKQALEKNLKNPIAPLIIQWRKINSILTRTIYPLLRVIQNNRIHGCCIMRNSTGRISMHEPNLQSIPRNFEVVSEGSEPYMINCRDAFEATDKCVLVSADYSQLELRVLAHFSNDPSLIEVLTDVNGDVFKTIAAKLNHTVVREVSDDMRQNAKGICYGIIYGMGIKGLAEKMGTSEEEAQEFFENFYEKFPMIVLFVQNLLKNCEKNEYVETLGGRRRYFPKINSTNHMEKAQATRQAVNTMIQGSAADIVKNAMLLIDKVLIEKYQNSIKKPELVLELHDEFLYEVPEKYLKCTAQTIKKCMEDALQLSVPLLVKIKYGKTWGKSEIYKL